jgi:hypothetical protein
MGRRRGSGAAGQMVDFKQVSKAGRRSTVRWGLVTAMIGLAAIWGWDQLQSERVLATTPVRPVTLASMTQRVREGRGHVVILALYLPDSDDPYAVADLRRWAVQTTSPKVEVLALAVGTRREAQVLVRYGWERGVQRLPPEWLPQQEPGALARALAELGIGDKDSASLPVTAVFNSNGKVTAQWQGELDYLAVLTAAKAARQQVGKQESGEAGKS